VCWFGLSSHSLLSQVGYYMNMGFATYSTLIIIATDALAAARALTYADVDADGLVDVVAVHNDGASFLIGNRVAWCVAAAAACCRSARSSSSFDWAAGCFCSSASNFSGWWWVVYYAGTVI
jgi:hypothetical protein